MCTGVTDPGYKALPVATSNYQHPTPKFRSLYPELYG